MLTSPDDSLRHQLPANFDHVYTSDPRFYDRYWFTVYDPEGSLLINFGMGQYSNLNSQDGYVAMQRKEDLTQHNFRVSRELRPRIDETKVGPWSVEVIEPFRKLRLLLEENDAGMAVDIIWEAGCEPHEEAQHYSRDNGRVMQEYQRYSQVGKANGTATLEGKTYEVKDWWGGRDHSWGVRGGVGGPDPRNGPVARQMPGRGNLFTWLPFSSTEGFYGHFQMHQNELAVKTYNQGMLRQAIGSGEADVEMRDVDVQFELHEGTRRWKTADITMSMDDGSTLSIQAEPLIRSWAMVGLGYDSGYEDGLGHGAYRGEYLEEHDVYDMSHPEKFSRVSDGWSPETAFHRETGARLVVNGKPGTGHLIILPSGTLPQYGLEG